MDVQLHDWRSPGTQTTQASSSYLAYLLLTAELVVPSCMMLASQHRKQQVDGQASESWGIIEISLRIGECAKSNMD